MTDRHNVNGIRLEDFQQWRHHPVSKVVLQFLRDYREAMHRELLERWTANSLTLADEHEMRGRSNTLQEFAEIQFESMLNFYKEGENAATTTEDNPG